MPEKFSTMRNSADLSESADSLGENRDSISLKQLNSKAEQREVERKSHEKIENKEHQNADVDLNNEISSLEISNENELNEFLEKHYSNNKNAKEIANDYFSKQNAFGRSITQLELGKKIFDEIGETKELSNEDQIKNYKEELTKQGKSQTEILNLLISNFEGNESVSVWVENWLNFQKLHSFAKTKPPAERKAIQQIIAKADFTSETAFSASLQEITQSKEISNETKFEISRKFGGSHIDSVNEMNYQLEQVKSYKKDIEIAIDKKNKETESLDSEIQTIKAKIDKLSLDDPKRLELEKELDQRKKSFDEAEAELSRLEKGRIQNISFQLRDGFSSVLNSDGSRSIKIRDSDFSIQLPSNRLPFTDTKNLRAINLSFPFKILKEQKLAKFLFRPNIENNAVPSKSQRDMGHLILSSLGIDDTKILSEENIKQLKKGLSFLNPKNGKSGLENLVEVGIYDVGLQSLDKTRLESTLKLIKENRNLSDNLFQRKIIE